MSARKLNSAAIGDFALKFPPVTVDASAIARVFGPLLVRDEVLAEGVGIE